MVSTSGQSSSTVAGDSATGEPPPFARTLPSSLTLGATRNLKPGGWIEVHDIITEAISEDGTADRTHPIHALYDLVNGPYADLYGWDLHFSAKVPQVLRELGFANITATYSLIPIGRWPHDRRCREMGIFSQSLISDWAATMLHRYETLGLNAEEAYRLGQDILDAFNDPQVHAQHRWIDVWAQKPC